MADWNKVLSEKPDTELDEIVTNYKDGYSAVLTALSEELKQRNYRTEMLPEIEAEIEVRNSIRKAVEGARIEKKTAFKWTPRFTECIATQLPEKLVLSGLLRVMLSLNWDIVHYEGTKIEAKRGNDWGDWTEKITASLAANQIIIVSQSLKNNLCDFGRNSKRVGELTVAFKTLESSYSAEQIVSELEAIAQREEANRYQIPDELTKPPRLKEKVIGFLVGGGFIVSIALGALLAFLSSFMYIIFLYDYGIGLLTALAFGYLMRLSHISDFDKLKWMGFASIGCSYLLSQVFRFLYIIQVNAITNASIWDYFSAKLNRGFQYKEANLGAIGLVIAWVIEIAIAMIFYYLHVAGKVVKYDLENAPEDVVEFANHWFNEGKDESGVRKELAQKGWHDKAQQDKIFKAVGARYSMHEFGRAE